MAHRLVVGFIERCPRTSRPLHHLLNRKLQIHEGSRLLRHEALTERVQPLRDASLMWSDRPSECGALRGRGAVNFGGTLDIVANAPFLC